MEARSLRYAAPAAAAAAGHALAHGSLPSRVTTLLHCFVVPTNFYYIVVICLQIPRTLDNTREVDDTIVAPGDEEVLADEEEDEFAPYFSGASFYHCRSINCCNTAGRLL